MLLTGKTFFLSAEIQKKVQNSRVTNDKHLLFSLCFLGNNRTQYFYGFLKKNLLYLQCRLCKRNNPEPHFLGCTGCESGFDKPILHQSQERLFCVAVELTILNTNPGANFLLEFLVTIKTIVCSYRICSITSLVLNLLPNS